MAVAFRHGIGEESAIYLAAPMARGAASSGLYFCPPQSMFPDHADLSYFREICGAKEKPRAVFLLRLQVVGWVTDRALFLKPGEVPGLNLPGHCNLRS